MQLAREYVICQLPSTSCSAEHRRLLHRTAWRSDARDQPATIPHLGRRVRVEDEFSVETGFLIGGAFHVLRFLNVVVRTDHVDPIKRHSLSPGRYRIKQGKRNESLTPFDYGRAERT